jgi:hypothetical protein
MRNRGVKIGVYSNAFDLAVSTVKGAPGQYRIAADLLTIRAEWDNDQDEAPESFMLFGSVALIPILTAIGFGAPVTIQET